MCGICGIVHFEPDRRVDERTLRKMAQAVEHRGPDGEGYFLHGNVGLGHTRLAVIDLSTGSQPMLTADKRLVVVFNGEIYNYIELRSELEAAGHTFRTTSDTEVILNAYRQWGFECQTKFNGMWAFALWDSDNRQLFISRDRMGEKPLHYCIRDKTFIFGSEIKSIRETGHHFAMATQLLHIYLSLGYIPAPFTFYDGIYKLLPGHFLVLRDGRLSEHVYWDLPEIAEADLRTDARPVYTAFESLFSESVKLRMRSDVRYGAFLSGGLDSSSVVAEMAQHVSLPIETFTIGFSEQAFDERKLARDVSQRFRTIHHEELAEPESFDEALQQVLFHFDEPFGDASAIPVGLVSRLARRKVTMALTGDGGDEVLSGYTSYRVEKLTEQYLRAPSVLRAVLRSSVDGLCVLAKDDLRYRLNRLSRSLQLAAVPFETRFISKLSLLEPRRIRSLIPADSSQIAIEDFVAEVLAKCRFKESFYRLMFFHLKVSLPDDMLTKVDRMSMAHSLEARVPFLDHRLVELAYCVDRNVKMNGYALKSILRRTHGRRLPESVMRAPKTPFSVPLRKWFKDEMFDTRLKDLVAADFGLDGRVMRQIVDANKAGRHDYGDFIWRLFVLRNWVTAH